MNTFNIISFLVFFTRNKHVLGGDHAVAGDDDVETSSYHVKDALDANFTYNSHSNKQPQSARQHGLRAGVNNQSNVNRGQLESGSRLRRQPYQPSTGQSMSSYLAHFLLLRQSNSTIKNAGRCPCIRLISCEHATSC